MITPAAIVQDMEPGQLYDVESAKKFIFAGNARFTARSIESGQRYTFRVSKKENQKGFVYFCSLLTSGDNESGYSYFGQFFGDPSTHAARYVHAKPGPGRPQRSAKSVMAFTYVMGWILDKDQMPPGVEVWHEGQCGRCGRTLTDPVSIASGFGPECIGKLGF